MMNNLALQTSTRKGKAVLLFSTMAIIALLFVPDLVYASDADDSIKDGVAFAVKMIKLVVYGLMGFTFIVMMALLLKSLWDWKDENKRDGTAGGIFVTLFVGLMVMGVIFLLGEKAITYVDTNIKVTQVTPIVQPLQPLNQLV
jgi:drug/metabolite transporter (DMT)-like permease